MALQVAPPTTVINREFAVVEQRASSLTPSQGFKAFAIAGGITCLVTTAFTLLAGLISCVPGSSPYQPDLAVVGTMDTLVQAGLWSAVGTGAVTLVCAGVGAALSRSGR